MGCQRNRVLDIGPIWRVVLGVDITIGNVQIKAREALGDFKANPPEPQNTNLFAPDTGLERVETFGFPRPVAHPLGRTDHAARLGQHHRYTKVGDIVCQNIRRVGDMNAAGRAGGHIDGVITHTVNRHHFKIGTGGEHGRRCAKFTTGRDAFDAGADLGQKRRFVIGFEISVHVESCVQRVLVPFGVVSDLKNIWFCHRVLLRVIKLLSITYVSQSHPSSRYFG